MKMIPWVLFPWDFFLELAVMPEELSLADRRRSGSFIYTRLCDDDGNVKMQASAINRPATR